MATPEHLNFSSPCVGDDSDHTPSSSPFVSQEKSERKRSASEILAKEGSKKKKKKKLDSSLFKRIWNEEDELLVLKGLVEYRIKSRHEPKIDWDGFYRFLGGSIVAKFSKEQVLSKIRKLKRRFIVHLERINERKDPNFTTSSDSEAFGFSMMLWGPIEVEVADTDVDKEMLKEHEEEVLNENGVAKITDNGTARNTQKSESGEEMLKEHEEVTNAEPLSDNGAAKISENGTTAGKESHDEDDELSAVRDAFETMMSQGLSDYQKKWQLKKLMNLGTGKRRQLSDEWKALCVEERRLNIKKLRFSAKLSEAANDR